jgi:mRNA interferase RelE/StbE
MAYKLQLEKNFIKHYKKLSTTERGMVDGKLRILSQDPWHPSLRTKRIQGTGEFEVSVNMDIRMAITFEDKIKCPAALLEFILKYFVGNASFIVSKDTSF